MLGRSRWSRMEETWNMGLVVVGGRLEYMLNTQESICFLLLTFVRYSFSFLFLVWQFREPGAVFFLTVYIPASTIVIWPTGVTPSFFCVFCSRTGGLYVPFPRFEALGLVLLLTLLFGMATSFIYLLCFLCEVKL